MFESILHMKDYGTSTTKEGRARSIQSHNVRNYRVAIVSNSTKSKGIEDILWNVQLFPDGGINLRPGDAFATLPFIFETFDHPLLLKENADIACWQHFNEI